MTSIAQTAQSFSANLQAALSLAQRGYHVFPLQYPIFAEDGTVRCSCKYGADCTQGIGKHPFTGKGGHLHATTDATTIENWFSNPVYPHLNIGIALAPSGLLVIGPDSDAWHEQLKERGLPDTYAVKSGNGYHYYYRAPSDMPKVRICHSQEYDILSDGFIVAAGSVHRNGRTYTVINDAEIADAPAWAVQMVHEHYAARIARNDAGDIASSDDNEPPVQLSQDDMAWWTGEKKSTHDDGSIDRSKTLYTIACRLARKNLSRNVIADSLRNRDIAFFDGDKFNGRHNAEEQYLSTVDDAISKTRAEREGQRESSVSLLSDDVAPSRTTDASNAERFAALHLGNIRYVWQRRKWAAWTGTHWMMPADGEAKRLAIQTARSIYIEAANAATKAERTELAAWAEKSESGFHIREMLYLAQAGNGIETSVHAFDNDPMLLTCKNGTLDLRTATLRPFNRDDLITRYVEYACPQDILESLRADIHSDNLIDRMAEESMHVRMVREALGDDVAVRELLKRGGIALTGKIEKEVVFCYGPTDTGKTAFLTHGIQRLLGLEEHGYATQVALESIGMGNDRRVSMWLADMNRIRFALASEPPDGFKIDAAILKAMSGETTQKARALYEMPYNAAPTYTMFMDTNFRPEIPQSGDDAIWNRVKLFHFKHRVKKEPHELGYIPNHRDLLQSDAEREALFACLVIGCLLWQKEGMGETDAMQEAKKDYRESMDVIGDFISDRLTICRGDETAYETIADVQAAFEQWRAMLKIDYKPTSSTFNARLEKEGCVRPKEPKWIKKYGASKKVWLYVKLMQSGNDVPPKEETFVPYSDGATANNT